MADELCLNVICYATVGLYYLNSATILEVLARGSQPGVREKLAASALAFDKIIYNTQEISW